MNVEGRENRPNGKFTQFFVDPDLLPSAGWLWKDTRAVLLRAERSTTYQLQLRLSDVHAGQIRKSDDLDNICVKIGRSVSR
jgi:hypothetical protein